GEKDNPPNFYLRMIEVEPGGHTPFHSHSKEHEVFILEGNGKIRDEKGKEYSLREGMVVYVPPREKHQFKNNGEGILKFLCIIPK
ncbi:cupin domain-containing protein, partial [SCandidatus Aminicenantes bacterium Aminicenantia_JdfR_composite]|nr:cupin domain-containing protein [SCandidatus Aminicenantes bacterium Aminicenantia_JdfR_composite]